MNRIIVILFLYITLNRGETFAGPGGSGGNPTRIWVANFERDLAFSGLTPTLLKSGPTQDYYEDGLAGVSLRIEAAPYDPHTCKIKSSFKTTCKKPNDMSYFVVFSDKTTWSITYQNLGISNDEFERTTNIITQSILPLAKGNL